MATKRQKKEEAKRLIDEAVPTFPIPRFAPAPVRALNLVLGGAEALGQGLVELDPLNILTDDRVMTAMINDPRIKMTPDFVALVNDDTRMVANTGQGLVEIPGQFDRSRLLPGSGSSKRTRKKTKTDKAMSKALREANARYRKKNGMLRKGVTQADVMRLAHRLRKKMM